MEAADTQIMVAIGFALQFARAFPKFSDVYTLLVMALGSAGMVFLNHHPASLVDFLPAFQTHFAAVAAAQGVTNIGARALRAALARWPQLQAMVPVYNSLAKPGATEPATGGNP